MNPRTRGFRAYPLQVIPPNWIVDLETLAAATSPQRVKQNLVAHTRSGVASVYVAIFAGKDPPFAHLRLAKLTDEALEKIDTKTGKEDFIELDDGQYFSESVHLVIDTANGLAIGEYRPNSLSVLGKWPGELVSHALATLGTLAATAAQPVRFEPFPSLDFLQRAIGRSVKKFHLKMGPVSPDAVEQAGIDSPVVEKLSLSGDILAFDLEISVNPQSALGEGTVEMLKDLAHRLGNIGAKQLLVTLEDKEAFDLLNDNLIYYAVSTETAPDAERDVVRARTLAELQATLAKHERSLMEMRP